MFKMKYSYIIVLVSFFLLGCGSKKGIITKKKDSKEHPKEVVLDKEELKPKKTSDNPKPSVKSTPKTPTSVDVYIETFATTAMHEMRASKIPASITLAQGILESGSGNGRLAKEANNHFGIKCHGWQGEKIYHDDDRSQECFRKYVDASESFKDHSEFLTGRLRYSKLFKLRPNDYKGWARGLKSAGYATDPKYPKKLISLIERYELHKYDDKVLGLMSIDKPIEKLEKHTVVKGDTLYSLSKRYNTSVEAIKRLNNLSSDTLSIGQEIIISN